MRLSFSLLSFSLIGCHSQTPRPAPAPDHVPDIFHGRLAPDQGGLGNRVASLQWWGALGDPLLNRIVEKALTDNYDLKVAEARLREARAAWSLAESERSPSVPAVAEYKRQHEPKDILGGRRRVDQTLLAGVDATWELDFFGRLRKLAAAAQANLTAQEAARDDAALLLAAEVCKNYVALRGHQQVFLAAQVILNSTSAQINLLERRAAAGRGTTVERDEATRDLSIERANAADSALAVTQAIHRLSVLTGTPPASLFDELSHPMPLPREPVPPLLSSPAELLRRRPDIRQAEQELVASSALDEAAAADLFPRIGLNGQLSVAAFGWSFGPTLSWDIFDRRRVRARQLQSGARADAAFARYQAAVLSAFEDVENAVAMLNAAHERRDALVSTGKACETIRQHAQREAELGVGTQLEIVLAEKQVAKAAIAVAAQEVIVREAWIALIKALGGGWLSPDAVVPAPPKPIATGTGHE